MSERLVTVVKYMTPAEAHVIKNRLEAEGIRVYLADEETVGMLWWGALGGVKVQVTEEHADRAAAVLEQPVDALSPDAPAEPVEESEACAEEEDRLRSQVGEQQDEDEDDPTGAPGDAVFLRFLFACLFVVGGV